MKVRRRMQRKIFIVGKDETVEKAQTLMAAHNIRHLPVVEKGRLVGIVSDRDVRGALIPQHLKKTGNGRKVFYIPQEMKIEEIMTADPISIEPGSDIEEAARLLINNKIGCLPVVGDGKIAGIITETDILWVFCEIMGVLESSCRVDVTLGRDPHALERATEIIRKNNGRIISVGMLPATERARKVYSFRLKSCDTGPIIDGLKQSGYKVMDEVG